MARLSWDDVQDFGTPGSQRVTALEVGSVKRDRQGGGGGGHVEKRGGRRSPRRGGEGRGAT